MLSERLEPILTDDDTFDRGVVLDGLKIRVKSQQFKSGRVTGVLAGITVDLRQAGLSAEGATINVQSALSGIDILVPDDWDVVCDIDAVFGGVDGGLPRTRSGPRLRVTGTVVAGGLYVR